MGPILLGHWPFLLLQIQMETEQELCPYSDLAVERPPSEKWSSTCPRFASLHILHSWAKSSRRVNSKCGSGTSNYLLVEFQPSRETLSVLVLQTKKPNFPQTDSFHHLKSKTENNHWFNAYPVPGTEETNVEPVWSLNLKDIRHPGLEIKYTWAVAKK